MCLCVCEGEIQTDRKEGERGEENPQHSWSHTIYTGQHAVD